MGRKNRSVLLQCQVGVAESCREFERLERVLSYCLYGAALALAADLATLIW